MDRSTELQSYTELAEHCLWEAERTLDREVARALRTLAERYKQMSKRSSRRDADLPSAHHAAQLHYHR
jgi:hypothetical protein